MKRAELQSGPDAGRERSSRWPWIFAAGCVLVLLLPLSQVLLQKERPSPNASTDAVQPDLTAKPATTARSYVRPGVSNPRPGPTDEQIVAGKVVQFAQSRRKLAHAMAERFKIPVADEMERFFDAAETGRFDEMEAIYKAMRSQRENGTGAPDYGPQWRAVVETEGAAEAAHQWPARKLLDFGNSVLGSLRPGMIYAGGTDPGCFIPTMLNETSDGEHHIVLTQNALADSS